MLTRSFAQAILYIVLLLFAQQSAYMHAAWHAGDHSSQHHEQKSDESSLHGQLCGLHGVFGQVLGGLQPTTSLGLASQYVSAAPDCQRHAFVPLRTFIPYSRGPPVHS